MSVLNVKDSSFKAQVLESKEPVVLDFWAEWCQPCLAVAPILDELAQDYKGAVKIAKINIDENTDTAVEYEVRSIPTMILFKDGQIVDVKVGASSKEDIKQWIEANK